MVPLLKMTGFVSLAQRNAVVESVVTVVDASNAPTPVHNLSVRDWLVGPRAQRCVTMPVVVVVNVGTSGPAELFAAALAENKRAELVGEKTQGRVVQQKLVPLPDGSALLVSNTWFLSPTGEAIQEKGVTPSVEVEEPDVEFGAPMATTDPLLLKAIERVGDKSAG